MNKYEMTEETIEWKGHTLHRIKSLILNGEAQINTGKLGGFIESEKNLSQDGYCWVGDNAKVFEDAEVSEDGLVYGNAEVYGAARIRDSASVNENAKVFENALITDKTTISENAKIFGSTSLYGDNVGVGGNVRINITNDYGLHLCTFLDGDFELNSSRDLVQFIDSNLVGIFHPILAWIKPNNTWQFDTKNFTKSELIKYVSNLRTEWGLDEFGYSENANEKNVKRIKAYMDLIQTLKGLE